MLDNSWPDYLTSLNHILADLYPEKQDSFRVLAEANIPRSHVRFSDMAITNWFEIINETHKREKILELIMIVRKEYPENSDLLQIEKAAKGEITLIQGPLIGADLPWKAVEPSSSFEKIIGKQSTLLPISFLEKGLMCSRSIGRVVLADGSMGSGFLTEDNIFMTNHHVFKDETDAEGAKIQFNYQTDISGLILPCTDYQPDPDHGFATSEEDDWSLVKVKGEPNQKWGWLKPTHVEVKDNDYVNIIQHPGGDYKQIALYHNLVVYSDDKRVQYLTDTLPGSSGSPVFNSTWQLVALHHSGGWVIEPRTKKTYFRNEGIHINVLLKALMTCGFFQV